jgi:hypothetical protein
LKTQVKSKWPLANVLFALINNFLVIRLEVVLTAAEQQLANSLPSDNIETAQPIITCSNVSKETGENPVEAQYILLATPGSYRIMPIEDGRDPLTSACRMT